MSFDAKLQIEEGTATIRLSGELDAASAPKFNDVVSDAAGHDLNRLVLLAADLSYMSSAGLRCLVLAQQKLPDETEIVLVGVQPKSPRPSGSLDSTSPSRCSRRVTLG